MLELKIGRIPVTIGSDFLIGTALLGIGRIAQPVLLIEWILVVGVSILLHELGHALAFKAYGRPARIHLHGLGGLTTSDGGRLRPLDNAIISLAGPATGLAFGGILYASGIEPSNFYGQMVVKDLLWVNVAWGILNLLPMVPLDGGHILESLLERARVSDAKRITLMVSVGVAGAAVIAAIVYRMPFGAILAAWFGIHAFQELRAQGDLRSRWR